MDLTKLRRQQLAIKKWIDSGLNGIINAAPGFGKTNIAKIAVIPILLSNSRKETIAKVLIQTKSSTLLDQLKEEFSSKSLNELKDLCFNDKYKDILITDELIENTLIFKTREAIISHNTVISVSLVIFDEIHDIARLCQIHGTSYIEVFLKKPYNLIETQSILGLTGTITEVQNELEKYAPVIDTITEKDCINNKWTAKSIVFNYAIELTQEQREKYQLISNDLNTFSDFFRFDKSLVVNNIVLSSLSHYAWACVGGYTKSADNYGFHIELDESGNRVKKDHNNWTAQHYCWLVAAAHGFHEQLDLNSEKDREIYDKYYPYFRKDFPSIQLYATKFNELSELRKTFLYNIHQKRECCVRIVTESEIAGLPTMIFTKHREDANLVANLINKSVEKTPETILVGIEQNKNGIDTSFMEVTFHYAEAIHSDIEQPLKLNNYYQPKYYSNTVKNMNLRGQPMKVGTDKVIETYLKAVRENYIRVICGTMILSQGINIPELQVVIMSSYDSSPITNDQASGRGKRLLQQSDLTKELAKDKTAFIINLYCKDTVEEDWLKNKQKNLLELPVTIYSHSQITSNLESLSDFYLT